MRKTLIVFFTVAISLFGLSFTEKAADTDICIEKESAYFYTEVVTFESYGVCGLLFKNVYTGEYFRNAERPDDMYVTPGEQYYITRELSQYTNESCELWKILTWSPVY